MLEWDNNSLKVAEFLLQIKAVKISPESPFTWASGLRSPIYCDNRKTLSFPEIRTFLRQRLTHVVEENWGNADVVAGVATGGIAPGVLVAQEMGLPFIYVRSSAKGHGLGNKVEGVLTPGQKVVVVEDLISTGKSSLEAVAALRAAGANVVGLVAMFTYGFDIAIENFKNADCEFKTLSNYDALLQEALDKEYINKGHYESLKNWKNDPKAWSESFVKSNPND
ncbi:MAG: orotate phosphoribosyltransferase [Flavobacteriales bacterium]|jgi:orotate phosphoribosyltransferase